MTSVFHSVKIACGVIVSVCFLPFFFSNTAWAQNRDTTRTIIVIESVDVQKDNKQQARELALSRSLKTAVNQAVSDLVPTDTLLYQFKAIDNTFSGKTDSYIQTYKVLTEFDSGAKYGVVVKVTVALDAILRRLNTAGINLDTQSLPSILVMVSETGIDDVGPRYWWAPGMDGARFFSEPAIVEKLKASGFRVISHQELQGDFDLSPLADVPRIAPADLAVLGEFYKADVIVSGYSEAAVLPNAMGSDIRSFQGRSDLVAVRTDTGEVFASAMQEFATTGSDEVSGGSDAMAAAAAMATEEIAETIVGAWREKKKKEGMLEIEVEGTSYLSSFVKFRRILGEMPGVASVQVKEMKADRGSLAVDYSGSARSLADALMRRNFDSFGITVQSIEKGRLLLGLATKKRSDPAAGALDGTGPGSKPLQ